MRFANFILLVVVLLGKPTIQEQIRNTGLRDPYDYMVDLIQDFLYDLENEGLCQLKMKDFSMPINESLYGLEVLGTVHFSKGFVVGMQSVAISTETTSNFPAVASLDNDRMLAMIYTKLSFQGLKFSYDVRADLISGSFVSNGMYQTELVEYTVTVQKNLTTNKVSSSLSFSTSRPKKGSRMEFLPMSDYSVVVSRNIDTNTGGISETFQRDWVKEDSFLSKRLAKVVQERDFPEIDYDLLDNN